MRVDRLAVVLCVAAFMDAAPARGVVSSVNLGDILLSDFGANHVQQFSPAGTLLNTFPSSGTLTAGFVRTPTGNLLVANRNSSVTPFSGTVDVFSPNGDRIFTFGIPEVRDVCDMALFPDGVLAITDLTGPVQEYTQAGLLVRTVAVGGNTHIGNAVSPTDGSLWVVGETSRDMHNLSEAGALLRSFTVPFEPRDLQVARDGTLWIGALFDSHFYHYTASGQQIGAFNTSLSWTAPLGLSPDESIVYVSNEDASSIFRYSTTGQALGSFAIPGAMTPDYIVVVAPEPSMISIVGVIAAARRRRR